MANPEHLKILKEGVKAWNKWRKKNPRTKPDLSEAYFSYAADLRSANLTEAKLFLARLGGVNLLSATLRAADLEQADLWNACLEKADLLCANLAGADLRGASLFKAELGRATLFRAKLGKAVLARAHLDGANLRSADLRAANLRGASLIEADLRRADLRGADFLGATLSDANFTEADLRGASFTPEGEPIGGASFLDLGSCIGIETATFSQARFLQDYLIRAFEYGHRADIPEAREWPNFLERAINNIRALRTLYAERPLPKQLIEVVHTITAELVKYLKKRPDALYQIRPRQFEELIAEILASYNWDVQLTPPVKDGGYDIFAISKDIQPGLKSSWIIECKKYGPEKKVGVDIVRAVYGIKSNLKVANALLATTSYFTKGAKAFKASRYDIELKDYRDILEWINQYRPNPNGKLYIKDNKLVLPNED